ncbi:SdrD B-like domain-containing protein [Runella sp. SP2]|uniref:SdrD B-like domain-containing protein n=1 Tax=Runella sp. SP2 TaxID=2268026 RepID=UPI0013DE3FB0|nr:SdrD B-like domain-containing protein [Runella sp. SP2]
MLFVIFLTISTAQAQVSGIVFRDFNSNGQRDATTQLSEPLVEGVDVQATDATGAIQTKTTNASGAYSFTGLTLPVRIQFSNIPSGNFSGTHGTGSFSSVQFFSANTTTANLGISNPNLYSQTAPPLVTNCYVVGSAVGNTQDAMIGFSYSAGCIDADLNGVCDTGSANTFTTPAPSHIATATQVGSTWGLAYHRPSKSVFAASFMKRHVGFKQKGKTGVIFRIENPEAATPTITEYVDLDALGFATKPPSGDPHPNDNATVAAWDRDANSWDWVGKMSLGDLDIDETEQNIYVVNLYDRKLYKIPIKSTPVVAGDITSVDIPKPATNDVDNRPFALGINNGKVYVGVTNTQESTVTGWTGGVTTTVKGTRTGLAMYVYEYDPNTGFNTTAVLNAPLTYTRKNAINSSFKPTSGTWNPWVNVFTAFDRENNGTQCIGDRAYPQPWLTDIEFDNGQMILGVRDRFGDQTGYNALEPVTNTVNQSTPCQNQGETGQFNGVAVGDLLRASRTGSATTWTLESNGSSGGVTTSGAGNANGPGGGEFYYQHSYDNFHFDIGNGGLVQVPGHSSVVETAYDVINLTAEAYNGGILWHNNTTGRRMQQFKVFDTSGGSPFAPDNNTLAKANGLGDLVALSSLPTIEIGNRIWKDANKNGIQDPAEVGVDGVVIELFEGTTTTGSPTQTVTSATLNGQKGTWYFTNLKANTDYRIKVKTAFGTGALATCAAFSPTGQGTVLTDNDTDTGTIALKTGNLGENNHSFDIGVIEPVGSIGNYIWKDANDNGKQDSGEAGQAGVIVQLLQGATVLATDTTDANGLYGFSNLDAGSYQVKILVTSLPAGCVISSKSNAAGVADSLDSDFDAATGLSQSVTITPTGTGIAKDNPTIDGALYSPLGSIGNYVWKDTNNNGRQDSGETGQAGIILQLLQGSSVVDEDTTDVNGFYSFNNLTSDTYQVKLLLTSLPAGCVISSKPNAAGVADTLDSDFNAAGLSHLITIDTSKPAADTLRNNPHIDAALFSPKGSIGDYVWKDLNDNGIQDDGPTGVKDVIVELYKGSTTGSPIAKDTTDASGAYGFTNLDAGDYYVKVVVTSLPVGCVISTKQDLGGDDTKDSDVNPVTGFSAKITLDPTLTGLSKDNPTIDAALYSPKGSIGNYVWKDQNDNGIQDASELGVAGVIVQLLNSTTSAVLATDTTDANGLYLFPNLSSGSYQVKIVTTSLPADCALSSQQDLGGDDEKDSDFNSTTGLSQAVTIDALGTGTAKDNLTVDAALYSLRGSIGDFVWKDQNDNGIQDPNESPVADVIVQLLQGGNVIATDTTNFNGLYLFPNLPNGTYQVRIVTTSLPDSCVISSKKDLGGDDTKDSDFDPTTALSPPITINVSGTGIAKDNPTIDAALSTPKGSIGDYVWKDQNNNGVQDSGEPAVAGVIVQLLNSTTSAVLATDTTDASGLYLFTNLKSGTYQVKIVTTSLPAGCVISSQQNLGGDDTKDSDFDPTTGLSQVVTIDAKGTGIAKDNPTVDGALFSPKGSIGDYVWKDLNNNGIQDSGEPGVSGVIIQLLQGSTVVATDTTNAQGLYLFSDLSSGTYQVKIVTTSLPDSCVISSKQDLGGDDTKDSDFNPTTGLSQTVTINATGTGLAKDNPTIDAGLFTPKGSIGDYVWKDQNDNGIQDSGEPGVAGVIIQLLKGATVVATDTTDANGLYLFPNLLSGTYKVKIVTTSLPAGCVISTKKDLGGDDTKDSDFDPTTGLSQVVTIDAKGTGIAKDNPTVDGALFSPKGSIGDYVWKDLNDNGIQDSGESGVSGVIIQLLQGSTVVATDTTNAQGLYLFSNLSSGSYQVKIVTTSLPPNCVISTKQNQGSDVTKDSDFNPTTGLSQTVTINATGTGLAKDNPTIDAGLVVPCVKSSVTLSNAPVCSADVQTYSITFTVTNKLGIVKANKGTLSGNNPYTVTGIPSGASVIITDSLSAVCKSDTTIVGPNCNCNPPVPVLLTPSMAACIGDTFPTLKATVVGLATVEWFSQQTGGTVLSTGLSFKPSGTVTGTTTYYAQARSTDQTCPTAVSTSRVPATVNAQTCIDTVDLALKKSINTKIAQVGDVLTYTLKVWNESNKNATGVEVADSIATTVQFIAGSFVASRGSATISGNAIKWTIGNIAANGDTVTLRYQVRATQEGLHFNTAEISKVDQKDVDSTPGNGNPAEDDIDRQCFSVPFKVCPTNQVEASVPALYTNVQWFKDGGTTPVATGNVVLFSEVGIYTFTATNQTCPAGGCCPIIIEPGVNCCPEDLCVPFTIQKRKKK